MKTLYIDIQNYAVFLITKTVNERFFIEIYLHLRSKFAKGL